MNLVIESYVPFVFIFIPNVKKMLDIARNEAQRKDNDKQKVEIIKKQIQPKEENIYPKN